MIESTDIESTQTKQIERAKLEWEVTVDVLPQLICLLDYQRCIIRANRTIERWQLGQVVSVKGKEIHAFLHPDCPEKNCYLATFLDQSWEKLTQGQTVECEAEDTILSRYLRLQIKPISYDETVENKAVSSSAVLVLEDITDQKKAEAALQQYALELEIRNEELDAFAHTVAHDLKAPLVPIIGHAEVLSMFFEDKPPEVVRKELKMILRGGRKMNNIIKELLVLAGVRKMEVQLQPIDMATVVSEVQQRLAFMITESEAEIVVPAEWPLAWGYGPWLEEVWVNYMSNAIKHGGRPPRLELGATLEVDDMVRFWIRDNGLGLTPEEQAKLFQPFTQLNQAQPNGHGLGLSIVRRIVEKLGGKVGVESQGIPGQGSVFSFVLPQASA